MYKVIKFFTDLQDNSYPYNVGDSFPRKGLEVSKARLEELSTIKNRQKTPLITPILNNTSSEVDNSSVDADKISKTDEEKPKTTRKRRNKDAK